jgi:glucosamine-6-phosphate deaminase
MHNLEKYDAVDITAEVRGVRNALGIPDAVNIKGKDYTVHPPKHVIVFAKPADLHTFVVDRWIQAARDSQGGHIIPTGATFEPVYAEAARRKTDVSPLLTHRDISNLDEVWPIREGDANMPLTYIVYRNTRVVEPLGLSGEQCIIPDGRTDNPHHEVVIFERKLADKTWDFAMLGIGPDEKNVAGRIIPASPHLGFIPRGTPPEQTAMFVQLDEGTIFANSREAPDPDHFFTHAITQGPGDIKRAERHLLVATGGQKMRNIRDVLFGPVDMDIPATHVLLYPETTIVLDTQSAQLVQAQIAI